MKSDQIRTEGAYHYYFHNNLILLTLNYAHPSVILPFYTLAKYVLP